MVDLSHAPSVAAVLREHARLTPSRTAVISVDDVERADGDTRLSYGELDAGARRVGAWLRARFPVGDRVLLPYPTGLDFVVAFAGCLYAGMVAVPAPLPGRYRHEQARVGGIAANARVSAILTDTENRPVVAEWATADGFTGPVLATDGGDLPDAGAWAPPEDLDHDTLAMLQYTSGTTDEPKGVILTHGNLLHNVDNQARPWGLTAQSQVGGWIPLYHDMGLLGQLVPSMLLGATCVLMRPATFLRRPDHWLRMIDKYDIGWTGAPNFAYELCCDRITDEQLAGLDLSRWRFAGVGAEPVDVATLAAFAKRFAPVGLRADVFCPCYGMAETTVFVSGDAFRRVKVTTVDTDWLTHHRFVPAEAGTDLVSCGTPHAFDVLIADPSTGEILAPGAIGEIWLRGPSLTKGYWGNERATTGAFAPGGYLRTGDLGTLRDGELYVTGRREELVTVHGRNLYPHDIERELRAQHAELAGVGAAFTVALRDDAGTEDVLVVTHEVNGRPDEDSLRRLAGEIGETVFREFGVHVGGLGLLRRGGVRRTTSGKIQRTLMRRLFLDGELNAVYTEYAPRVADALRIPQPEPVAL